MTPARPEVHLIAGTAREAIRLAPVATAMREAGLAEPVLVAVGPRAGSVHQALAAFGQVPAVTLDCAADAGLDEVTGPVGTLGEFLAGRTPSAVVVQGDTPTTLAGAIAASWRRIPLVHLEAGVRAGDLEFPFPEGADRRLVAQLATMHLAPTPLAAMNLFDEGVEPADVLLTGSTVVDAALAVGRAGHPYDDPDLAAARAAAADRRLVVLAAQGEATWGVPLGRVLSAVHTLVQRYADIDIVVPGHPDPSVREQVAAALCGGERVTVTGALSDADLTRLLGEAHLVLTDSAAIEEAAPSFRVPVLVLREITECLDGLHAGCTRLVGSDDELIVKESAALLDDPRCRQAMTGGGSPYGDGYAGQRAAQAIAGLLNLAELPEPMPVRDPAAPVAGDVSDSTITG